MKILAHRGHWKNPSDKNTPAALALALAGGFGLETDVRDALGELVVSHDPPRGGEMTLDELLTLCSRYPRCGPLALNIKSDGLQAGVRAALQRHGPLDAFVFDMAVPDALGYLSLGLATYTRCSEYERAPPFLALASGIWLDAFHSEWYDTTQVASWLDQDRPVCLVSPELHGRPHQALWSRLRSAGLHQRSGLAICTDFPLDAKEAFCA